MFAEDLPIHFFVQQDKRLLDCILNSLLCFQRSVNPLPIDASMIYSAGLLYTCACAGTSLLDSDFHSSTTNKDIDALARSRQEFQIQPTTDTSSNFQQIVDRIVEHVKRCSGGFPTASDRMFWMQKHHCIWMLIYWLCDTFEVFLALFEAIGYRSPDFHPVHEHCLIKASLLREDLKFPRKFLSFLNLKPNSVPNDLDILFAICNDDIAALKTTISKIESMTRINWDIAWELAYTHLKWDSMEVLFSVPNVDLHYLYKALFWFMERHKWDELQVFSEFIRLRAKDIHREHGNSIILLLDMDKRVVHSCAEIIHEGSSHNLEFFLDIVQRLDPRLHVPHPRTQLTILPALASRNLSILKILFETYTATSYMEAANSVFNKHLKLEQSPPGYLPPSHFSSTIPQFPLDLAIAFILDLEIIDYLCRPGARLQEDWNGAEVVEPETLRKLRLTTSIADARKQNCHIKGLFYQMCSTEFFKRLHKDSGFNSMARYVDENEHILDNQSSKP
ncbi:hypothetical protein J3E68DRAFT_15253 [Trichoderma sp. SZMC 28012]